MKKLLVALCALALIAIPLFAQGGAETTTAVDDSKPITIEFWTHEDAARQALEEKYIAEYTAQHPNVTINVTRQSAEENLFRQLSLQDRDLHSSTFLSKTNISTSKLEELLLLTMLHLASKMLRI